MAEKKESKGKKVHKKSKRVKKSSFYKLEGSGVVRSRKTCIKCGPGVFMAEHKDRHTCGKCNYTEFKKQGQ